MKLFYLTKSDRRTIILLLCIIATALGVIYLTDSRQETAPLKDASVKKVDKSSQHIYYYQGEPRQAELFPFDPNTADSTQLLRLGLQPWQVRNIYKYRAAGGVYRKPRDFARLYGLTLKQYRRLEPFIRIKEEDMPADNYFYAYEPIEERDTVRYPIKIQSDERIVLNRADTTTLRKVPGIGSHFARKIVEYRRRLGGFYRVQQLLEIEDFPETAIAFFIIPDSTQPKPCINVNRLSLNELKRHPYINFYQARDIVDYRRLHGPIKSLKDLSLSRDFTPEAIERLEAYVTY
jgi:DNA uptake protein ComE-like DNA-binding protein